MRLLVVDERFQLGQRNCEFATVPPRQNKHLVAALLLRRHAQDLHLVTHPQRRDGSLGNALGKERELEPLIEVDVPPHRLLIGRISIDDDLHGDALFALVVLRRAWHHLPARPTGSVDRVVTISANAWTLVRSKTRSTR